MKHMNTIMHKETTMKQMELASKIAKRVTNPQMNTIQSITNAIYEDAKAIKLIKVSCSYPDAKIEKASKRIIDMKNHIHELQTYIKHLEKSAIGEYNETTA
jgi:hypothetical protein